MTTEITKVKGVGGSMAQRMKEAGIETAEDLANAEIKEIADISYVKQPAVLKNNAAKLTGEFGDLNVYYNPLTEEYEPGQDEVHECKHCGIMFVMESVRNVHEQDCDEAEVES